MYVKPWSSEPKSSKLLKCCEVWSDEMFGHDISLQNHFPHLQHVLFSLATCATDHLNRNNECHFHELYFIGPRTKKNHGKRKPDQHKAKGNKNNIKQLTHFPPALLRGGNTCCCCRKDRMEKFLQYTVTFKGKIWMIRDFHFFFHCSWSVLETKFKWLSLFM